MTVLSGSVLLGTGAPGSLELTGTSYARQPINFYPESVSNVNQLLRSQGGVVQHIGNVLTNDAVVNFGTSGSAWSNIDWMGVSTPVITSTPLTVAGTITNGDSLVTIFTSTNPLIVGSPISVTAGIVTADTSPTIAAKVAAAINANSVLAYAGVSATSNASVVTVNVPASLSITLSRTNGTTATLTIGSPTTVSPSTLFYWSIPLISVANGTPGPSYNAKDFQLSLNNDASVNMTYTAGSIIGTITLPTSPTPVVVYAAQPIQVYDAIMSVGQYPVYGTAKTDDFSPSIPASPIGYGIGSRVWNSAPVVGAAMGWILTATGWRSMGSL